MYIHKVTNRLILPSFYLLDNAPMRGDIDCMLSSIIILLLVAYGWPQLL